MQAPTGESEQAPWLVRRLWEQDASSRAADRGCKIRDANKYLRYKVVPLHRKGNKSAPYSLLPALPTSLRVTIGFNPTRVVTPPAIRPPPQCHVLVAAPHIKGLQPLHCLQGVRMHGMSVRGQNALELGEETLCLLQFQVSHAALHASPAVIDRMGQTRGLELGFHRTLVVTVKARWDLSTGAARWSFSNTLADILPVYEQRAMLSLPPRLCACT
ncbi:hypothetical protein FN846DRAFT_887528 [Sphaerosporella brunnea]|uniref:Uncharacterized protein n=1 Tax=Sphaerosporella brunnea TaxID=1250544 RepID=A0A5J5F641_9PEZI|nr:hypothetical protein FN846DRAFT_887528 [Sphaerosporella brunnea]